MVLCYALTWDFGIMVMVNPVKVQVLMVNRDETDRIDPKYDRIEPKPDRIEPKYDRIEPISDRIDPKISDRIEPKYDRIEPKPDRIVNINLVLHVTMAADDAALLRYLPNTAAAAAAAIVNR